jgi:hypothetical protein
VSRDAARYLCIPEYTKRGERQGRGPEAISQESEVKSANCCVENYGYVHRRLLYRDIGKNLLHARNTQGRLSDTIRTMAKAKTSKAKTNKGKGTRKKSTESKTNKNQEITQARTQFSHTRSKSITNPKTQAVPPTSRTEAPQ